MKIKTALSLLIIFFTSATVWGENPPESLPSDTSRIYDLDETVVVAQPKENFRLRYQPVASTLFSDAEMKHMGMTDLRDVSAFVPSFQMPAYGARYTSAMYVRGIGSRVNSPAVGIYTDGIPLICKSMYNFHFYEYDRVDVLRGPQGTLYGMNTEGGLVRMYSKNPMKEEGTQLKLGGGTHALRSVEAAHNMRLGEKSALSIAGFYEGQDGFLHNTTTGKHADAFDEAGGKLRWVYLPTDRLSMDLGADYQFVRQNGFAYGELDATNGKAAKPAMNRNGNYRRNMLTTLFNVHYRFKNAELTSSTSFQYLHDNMMMDIDYLPKDLMHMQQQQDQKALTQELTLKGSPTNWWKQTSGIFFSHQWLRTTAPVIFDADMHDYLSATITNAAYQGMLQSMAARMGETAAAAMIAARGGVNIRMELDPIPGLFHTPQTNFGLFHQSDFHLSKQLVATLGLRYDFSHVAIDYDTQARTTLSEDVMGTHVDASVVSVLKNNNRNDFNQLLPKVGLTYHFGHHGDNVYATLTKGYRAGGYNIQMFSDILQTQLQANAQTARTDIVLDNDANVYDAINSTISYKPETSWNYEAGAHLNLFNHHLQLDMAAYYLQVRNLQLSVMAGNYGFGRRMVNAGKSYSCGLELSLRGMAFDQHLSWGAAYSLTHSAFKEYKDESGGVEVDYDGKRVPFIPMHSLSAYADAHFPMKTGLVKAIVVGANLTAQGSLYWDEANTYKQKFYAVAGAHLDAETQPFTLSLWVRNLTDTRYNTFAFSSAASGSTKYFAQRGNPIQFGADIRFRF